MITNTFKMLIISCFFFFFGEILKGQQVYIKLEDGTESAYKLEDVRKITFTGDVMNLLLKNGTTYFWNVSKVNNYKYRENPASTAEWLDAANDWKLKLYPNPAGDVLNVSYYIAEADEIAFSLYGLDGKLIREESFGKLSPGDQLHAVSLQNLPAGTYLMRLSGQKAGITQTIIKN